ncbi:MAG TPA: type II/IV secretion system ATPase subunit [Candidatus Nanoarchaeia archaeon]|nr:type II/IV secretion system ATPase subunit [Candidatus Nanoarchaeia archaeon]
MAIHVNLSPPIPALARNADKTKVDIRYSLVSPYANAHIYWDSKAGELMYEIEEPVLKPEERVSLDAIEEAMLELVNINVVVEKTIEAMIIYIDKTARLIIDELNLRVPEDSYTKLFYYIYRDFIGFDQIDPMMRDYFIEDIECNGANAPLYIVHRVYRNLRTNVQFKNMEMLASFVEKLAQRCGRYISYAQPLLDGTLPDGSRINATYTKDVTSRGPTFTIRKFTQVPWTPTQLLAMNTLSPEMLAYFWLLLQYKSNIMVAGGTSSGKTTLLNAIAFFIPPEARVISIEDTREINLPRENWLPAVARTSIGTGKVGEVDLFDLLKNSFRQNPDYVIVGEVRGKEAFVLFQGMASGHSSMSTIHADSLDTLIRRLQTPPISLSPTLVNSLDCVVIMAHALLNNQHTRRLREIVEVISIDGQGTALVNTPFVWNPAQDIFYFKKQSKVFEKISARFGISLPKLQEEFVKRARLLYTLYQRKVFGFTEMQEIVNEYYRDPAAVLARYGVV